MNNKKEKNTSVLKIKQIVSSIRCYYKQRLHLQSLGLRFVNHEVEVIDSPSVRGIIRKVSHMIRVNEG
jgi:large subunit ribosomal protein L30